MTDDPVLMLADAARLIHCSEAPPRQAAQQKAAAPAAAPLSAGDFSDANIPF